MAQYRPGVCNIGRHQQRLRLSAGAASAGVAVVYTAWVLATGQSPVAFAGTALFAAGAVLGALQYHLEFCVSMAALARYDLTGSGGEAGTIAERSALHTDRWRAAQILAVSTASGGLVGVTAFVVAVSLAPA